MSSDLPDAIIEESAESGSESPIEPVTPTSGRLSQDFTTLPPSHFDSYLQDDHPSTNRPVTPRKPPILTAQSPTPPRPIKTAVGRPTGDNPDSLSPDLAEPELERTPSRRSTRGSYSSSLKRKMSSIFRRSNSQAAMPPMQHDDMPPAPTSAPNGSARLGLSTPTQDVSQKVSALSINGGPPPSKSSRRFSITRSATTTRSNTPPTPSSPLEVVITNSDPPPPIPSSVPNTSFLDSSPFGLRKNNRSATGLGLKDRVVNFAARGGPAGVNGRRHSRRANSFDSNKRSNSPYRPPQSVSETHQEEQHTYPLERLPWALPPDAGTGVKARRMSLSLPDDFTVDVVELLSEFEYQSKLLGRHGKHLGKGAASKVTLMARKGSPTELYAVKEFRGKSKNESKEDYEKKIKSEYSIAKSLHHPNVVETFRLCTDHSRWNHVMEYCSEGDLFSLVSKGWLKGDDKKKDRLCLFKQLIQGVNYLHNNGIAHRDIKLENLLITKDSKLKITDFGVSEVFCGTHPGVREAGGQCGRNMGEVRLCSPGICGSEPYIAPEVLAKKGKYDPRPLDVWSAAIVMIYLTFGGCIWPRAEPGHKVYDNLVRGWWKWNMKHEPGAVFGDMDYPHCEAFDLMISPPALRRVMLQMLNPDPAQRTTIQEVANNRWMKNIECCQLESYDDPTLVIDATKIASNSWNGPKKIFCHSHLPPKGGSHSLGKMPGQAGY